MSRKFDKRIIDLKTQNEDIKKFIDQSDSFIEAQLNPVISKQFSESVSLAISQVNGCKLCSYTHAKNALKAGMTEEEVDSVEWIHKYSLAWAKEFLGRIRSKYGSVPGPTGEMQLDGATLLQEAQMEKEKLEESVILRGQPLGFLVG